MDNNKKKRISRLILNLKLPISIKLFWAFENELAIEENTDEPIGARNIIAVLYNLTVISNIAADWLLTKIDNIVACELFINALVTLEKNNGTLELKSNFTVMTSKRVTCSLNTLHSLLNRKKWNTKLKVEAIKILKPIDIKLFELNNKINNKITSNRLDKKFPRPVPNVYFNAWNMLVNACNKILNESAIAVNNNETVRSDLKTIGITNILEIWLTYIKLIKKNIKAIIQKISAPDENILIKEFSFNFKLIVANFCVKTIFSPKSIDESIVKTLLAAIHKPIVLNEKNFK